MRLDRFRTLIVGGGIGGMSAAIQLRRAGASVDLIDLDPEWRVYGAGITISGPTLRAYETLGVMDEILASGYVSNGLRVYASDGSLMTEIPGNPVINAGGITRPVLHDILARRVRELGTNVRLGVSVDRLQQHGDEVDVDFTDHTAGSYDLVVGADGIYSKMRGLLFPDAPKPTYTGQGAWRLLTERPAEVTTGYIFLGKGMKSGLTPCSPAEMYLFLLNTQATNGRVDPAGWHVLLGNLLEHFTAPILTELRSGLCSTSNIVYRPLEALLVPPPWHRGSIILIGDAVHSTTPHLASGAGITVEDAIVLVEELTAAQSIAEAFASFMDRRYERCRMVVESSVHIGALEIAQAPDDQIMGLMAQAMGALMAPI